MEVNGDGVVVGFLSSSTCIFVDSRSFVSKAKVEYSNFWTGFVVLIEFLDLSYELWIGCNVVWWRYYGCVSIYKGQLTFVTFL